MKHTLGDGSHVGLSFSLGISLGISLGGRICPDLGSGFHRCQSVLDDLGPILSLRRYPYPGCGEDLGCGDELSHVDGLCNGIVRRASGWFCEQRTGFNVGHVLGDNNSNGNILRLCHGLRHLDSFCLRHWLATDLIPEKTGKTLGNVTAIIMCGEPFNCGDLDGGCVGR